MSKPITPSRLGNLQQKIKTRLVRGCGEQQISYRLEVLDLFARLAAETALQELGRGELAPKPEPAAVSSPLPAPPPLPFGMTAELLGLLELITERLTDAQVARRLRVSERQVKRQLRELYGVLGTSGRFESIVTGYEAGLLGPDARSARATAVSGSVARSGARAGSGPRAASQAATGASEGFGASGGAA